MQLKNMKKQVKRECADEWSWFYMLNDLFFYLTPSVLTCLRELNEILLLLMEMDTDIGYAE